MSAFMVGDALLVGAAQEERALGAEHDFLERIEEVLVTDLILFAASRQQRRFIDQVLQVGSREP